MVKYKEETIETKTIFNGKIVKLREDQVILSNGNKATREVVEHNGAVAVLPINEDGDLFLVKQFRKPVEQEILELPAGKLEVGEDPQDCAIRELEEEIGYRAGDIKKLTSFYTSPGFSNEIIHIFVASDLKKTQINRDDDELMDILEMSFEKVKNMIYNGKIIDAKTIVGILYFLQKNK